jgi:hypothetical protein
VLRLGIAVSLVTFFAAAKKVTAAPHRAEPIDRHEFRISQKSQTDEFRIPQKPNPKKTP